MNEIINGFPAYTYPICLSFQFFLFPLMSAFYTAFAYNTIFTAFLLKDYFYDIDYIISAHHILAIVYLWAFCKTKREMMTFTIAEVGSGVYNLYTLAVYYNYHVRVIHMLYFFVMTLSNLYVIDYIRTSNKPLYVKIPAYIVLVGREYFIFL
jgi:hypothetical protein